MALTNNEATKEYFVSTPVPTTCHPATFLPTPIVVKSINTSPERANIEETHMFYLISKDPMTQYLLRIEKSSLTTILGFISFYFFSLQTTK